MVNRRDFIKRSLSAAAVMALPFGAEAFSGFQHRIPHLVDDFQHPSDKNFLTTSAYLSKIKNFNQAFLDDIHADVNEFALIRSCVKKTNSLMRYVGFGNFNILNFDDALRFMDSGAVTAFSKAELDYIEELFSRDASVYGFYGEKIFDKLTSRVKEREMVKIPGSGHYVYGSVSLETYKKITSEMKDLVLTSGVRSVVKQLHLFLNKAIETNGNLSMASRSIAPVGYSYHGIGDFDVGIKGWGYANFTDKFATTKEYATLLDRGYMRIRYDRKNPYGVRFEPWHVKVV